VLHTQKHLALRSCCYRWEAGIHITSWSARCQRSCQECWIW